MKLPLEEIRAKAHDLLGDSAGVTYLAAAEGGYYVVTSKVGHGLSHDWEDALDHAVQMAEDSDRLDSVITGSDYRRAEVDEG